MKRLFVFISFLVLVMPIAYAHSAKNRNNILYNRLNKIEFYHFGIGGDIAINKNYGFGPKVYIGVGSTRNLLNADFGLKLLVTNPWRDAGTDYVRWFSMPIFVSGSINAIRWKRNSVYVGAEIAYNVALGSGYHGVNSTNNPDSQNVASNHSSGQGKLGFRNEFWDFSLYYEDDLAPALNQKYIYESPNYDYSAIRESIFERWRIGVSVAYNFRF